jgi:hypothetical protein
MSDNLGIYNAVRKPPAAALKEIKAGRLKGRSDINPMWRIKALTEQFGPCGFGWKYIITKQWLENGANGEIAAFVNIDLLVKVGEEWSAAIPGTGGSSFVAKEKGGLYTSDECFKMALTDAISVACKALGFAADVYWSQDPTKYNRQQGGDSPEKPQKGAQQPTGGSQGYISPAQAKRLYALSGNNPEICKSAISKFGFKSSNEVTKDRYAEVAAEIERLVKGA